MDSPFIFYHIAERSFVSYIKREIHLEISRAHFSDKQVAEIDIIVSELCSNLIKHAGGGDVMYRTSEVDGKHSTFEILCIDKGPGMNDVAKMMKDGVSTTGTLGNGLGAIERLSTFSQVYSVPGAGTIAYAVVSSESSIGVKKYSDIELNVICINKPREIVCGDGYGVRHTKDHVVLFLADGLGHGEHAKNAVDTARNFLASTDVVDPVDIIRRIHERARRTRGLVATVAVLDKRNAQWKICGVGNITTRVYNGILYKNYMSYNGTIGLNIPSSMNATEIPVEKNQHVIMCSDGLRSRWDLNSYPAIFKYHNLILAAALHRDYSRGNDDSSILITKVTV